MDWFQGNDEKIEVGIARLHCPFESLPEYVQKLYYKMAQQFGPYSILDCKTVDTRRGANVHDNVFDELESRWFYSVLIIPSTSERLVQSHSSNQRLLLETMLLAAMKNVHPSGHFIVERSIHEESKQAFFNVFSNATTFEFNDVEYLVSQKMHVVDPSSV